MKRVFILVSLFFAFYFSPVNAIEFICEPEDHDAVSYNVFFYGATQLETMFIKLAPSNHQDEYWLRMSELSPRDKVLNAISIDIDGKKYDLISTTPDFDADTVASVTYVGEPAMRTNIRFFKLSPEIVQGFKTAKSVKIRYSTYKILNQIAPLKTSHLENINKAFSLEYEQYPEYWKPRDESK